MTNVSGAPVPRAGAGTRGLMRAIGSLWFAAVLLVLWLVAMASATVFEMLKGSEWALAAFYKSWWFRLLLSLLAVNVLAALLLRIPFSKRQIGFVLTHVGILVTLVGATVTWLWGIDGRVAILEGETINELLVGEPVLRIGKRADGAEANIDLAASAFSGFRAIDRPAAPELRLGKVGVQTLSYLPDSSWVNEIRDDSPFPSPAVEVAFGPTDQPASTWVFADRRGRLGSVEVGLRQVLDQARLEQLLAETRRAVEQSDGLLKIEVDGAAFDVPLQASLERAVPLGDTGYAIHTLGYFPHAIVGANNQLTNASDHRDNPAIEVEIIGNEVKETRKAFARYPGFGSMHGEAKVEELQLTFVAPKNNGAALPPIEVLKGPKGSLHVRFSHDGEHLVSYPVTVGTALETPWPGLTFEVSQSFDRARFHGSAVPVEPIRETRMPAVLLEVSSDEGSSETWVQKYRPRSVVVDGSTYDVVFAEKTLPLGFGVKLNDFRIGYYPGERMPRSFESRITIIDPTSQELPDRLISMNNPTKHGGFTFYQSSYQPNPGRMTSVLSVSKDPGKPVVFAGYITIMVGMVVVLAIRMDDQRRKARALASSSP